MLMALYDGNPPVTGGFPSQRVSNVKTRYFYVVSLNKLLSKKTEEFLVIWYDMTLTWRWHITEGFPYFLDRRI